MITISTELATVQSVQRTFTVLEHLCKNPKGITISQLSQKANLAKSTTHRLLQSLIAMGYAVYGEGGVTYRPTLKVYELGNEMVSGLDILSFTRAPLERLSEQTGETIHLVVRDGLDIVYIHKVEAAGMSMASRIGQRRPLYCTAVGKAILARQPFSEAKDIFDRSEVKAITPNTIVSFSKLQQQLEEIQARGWALDEEENEIGITCVAVALPSLPFGDAAFSISSLSVRMNPERIGELAGKCLEIKQSILNSMGLK